ncbi:type VI secretion system tube protein Hcp [Paraburkholderia sediminicola]|uniref:Hcp family type VI secretion system effector n=1 Tax=Paraburkholderia sediminicola TaxID=458836 RepID=UPI0038B6BE40
MAVDIFLKLGDIKGESTDDTHADCIDVLSWSWGASQSGTMHMGTGGGAGKVSIQDMSFTKYTDKATAPIIASCCKGTHIDEALMTVRKAGGTSPLEYYKVTMNGVIISSYSTGGAGGDDRFTEHVTLNFEKFHIEYQPQDAKGAKEGGVIEAKWDIPKNSDS